MRNYLVRKVTSFLAMTVLIVGVTSAFATDRTWTRSEILAIADKEARKSGYDVEKMSVKLGSFGLEEWCGKGPGGPNNRKHWTVYYGSLNEMMLGGDLCVFIDRETGEVLGTFQGE